MKGSGKITAVLNSFSVKVCGVASWK